MEREPRPDRLPASKHDPTDPATARARAAEAELRTETATYEGVRRVIANSGAAAERAAERRANRQGESAGVEKPDERRRLGVRVDRQRAAEAVALARIEFARIELAAATEAAESAAAEDVRRANELAAVVAQQNAENAKVAGRVSRALGIAESQQGAPLPAEVEAAVVELARIVGAITETRRDGRLTVTIGERPLVDRGSVNGLELHELIEVSPSDGARGGTDRNPRTPEPSGRSLEVVWPHGRVVEGLGGTLAGHLTASNTLLPQVALVVEEIATVARAEAALAADTPASAGGDPLGTGVMPAAATAAHGSPELAPPSASDLLDELAASLTAASTEAARRYDVASAVAAITAGPPAGFFAAVVAAAGEVAPAGGTQIAARASQQMVSDLQHLSELTAGVQNSAWGLAKNTPFVPIRVTSSEPTLVRVDTPWPSAGLLPTGSAATGSGSVTGSGPVSTAGPTEAGGFDPDAIASPLQLHLSVVSVAHGDVVMSRGGVPAGVDIAGGLPVSLVIGTSAPAAHPGEAPGAGSLVGEVTVPAPVTIGAVAEAINAGVAPLQGAPAGQVSAGVQHGADGLTHLIMESDDGAAWLAARRADGTSRDVLGGFSLLAPRTDSLVVSTGSGLGWTGISEDREIEGPLPGLGLTLLPGSEGSQVTLTVEPALDEVTDAVDEFVRTLSGVLVATGTVEAEAGTGASAAARPGPSAGAAAASLTDTSFTDTGTGSVDALASPNAAGAGSVAPSIEGTGSPQGAVPAAAIATDAADDATAPAIDTGTTADRHVTASAAPPTTPQASAPTSPASPPVPPTPLGTDPAIMDLAAAFMAAISGVAGPPGASSGPGASTALAGGAGTQLAAGASAIPGLTLDVAESGRRRLVFDREAFARAVSDEPTATRTAVRAAAAEAAGAAREALDGRIGLFAVRLHDELTAARRTDVRSNAPEWGQEQREIEAGRRAEALSQLLERLDAESKWLGGHLA